MRPYTAAQALEDYERGIKEIVDRGMHEIFSRAIGGESAWGCIAADGSLKPLTMSPAEHFAIYGSVVHVIPGDDKPV